MHSDFTLQELSFEVYHIDPKHKDYIPLEIGEIEIFGDQKFQILQTESNPTNSMQAMAVAS